MVVPEIAWVCSSFILYEHYNDCSITAHFVCVDAPTLLEIMTMKGTDRNNLRVIGTIAAGNYMTFGMCLLQDKNGVLVDLHKRNHIHEGVESVVQAILRKWLTSDAPTRTYQHLIECLRQSELGALAESIANTAEGNYANILLGSHGSAFL